jgi:hypothetical protein
MQPRDKHVPVTPSSPPRLCQVERATQARPWLKLTCDFGAWRRRERPRQRWLPALCIDVAHRPLANALPVMQPAKDARSCL